jgi:SAM-dependent methyltransferase
MSAASGVEIYRRPEVVAYYDREHDLHGAERLLFERYVKPGAEILDLGVGAGRTTPHLARFASRYVGVDLSEAMVARCREKFPDFTFLQLDATHLSTLGRASFDVVVFSFNGIDAIPTVEGRRRCLAECARVLRTGGHLLFSVHNPRYLFFTPQLDGVGPMRALWRSAYAALSTAAYLVTRLPAPALWRGSGFVLDPMGPALAKIYVAGPDQVSRELAAAGLAIEEQVAGQFPRGGGSLRTPWYYYACLKRGD